MSVRSAQSITATFTTRALGAGATNATGTPTGTLYVNGTANGASVTVTNITTGIYKFAVTLPTLAFGDVVEMLINATVSSVTDNCRVWWDTKDIDYDTSGIVSTDAKKINAVSTSSVTTINANVGTTQPVNYTGTGGSALVKTEVDSFLAGVGPLAPPHVGTCQAGSTSTTIVLDTGASSVNDYYNNSTVFITGGTGSTGGGQTRKILDYVGSTRTATVRAWTTTPDNTTTFAILPDTSAWDDVTADHLTAGSTGFTLNAGGDPWSTQLPGTYLAGSAGRLVGRSLPDVVAGAAKGLHILGDNVGDLTYTGVTNSAVSYTGAAGLPAVSMTGTGNNAIGLQINGGTGSNTAGIVVLGRTGVSFSGSAGAGLTISGTTFSFNCTGAVSMTNASNSIILGTTQDAATGVACAAAWGVSVVGNSRTRDYFLQGGINKFQSSDPSTGFSTLYQTDDTTALKIFSTTSAALDPIVSMDPA
jgi:hypothetical protein